MELEIIMNAGLSRPAAKTYLALLENGKKTPAELCRITGETRTNTYALLQKLQEADLVKLADIKTKPAIYEACHPTNLESYVEKRRRAVAKNEQLVKTNLSILTDTFYSHNSLPGAKTYTGLKGAKEIYKDVLVTKEDVYLIRTTNDEALQDFIAKYRESLAKSNITTYALAPDTRTGRANSSNGTDGRIGFVRTRVPRDAFEIPVSIMIYGDKTAFVSYEEDGVSTIIVSKSIAEVMKQLFLSLQDYWQKNYPQK